MTSSKNTAWIAGTGVLAVLILLASYFLMIAPKRAEASETATQAAGVEQSNETLVQETARLEAQFATLDEQRAQLATIRGELPSGSEVPALIRQFTTFASGAGVTVTDIAPGTLTPYVAAAPGAGGATSVDTAAAANSSGILSMPVSVTVDGTFAGAELFVKNLQSDMHRYLLVDSVDLVREDALLSTTINGRIFVLDDGTGAAASATATTDTTAATASAASTSTGTVS